MLCIQILAYVIAAFGVDTISGQLTNITLDPQPNQARGADVTLTTTFTFNSGSAILYFNALAVENAVASFSLAQTPTTPRLCLDASLPNVPRNCTIIDETGGIKVVVTFQNVNFNYSYILWDLGVQTRRDFSVKDCGNVTSSQLVNDVPAKQGYLTNHTFSCNNGYQVSSQPAVCEADATWKPTPTCTIVCNDTTVPSSSSYITPTSGTTLHMNTLTLQCAGNYIGSASAVCTDVDVWNVNSSCTPSCNQSTIPTDASYSHSSTSVSLLNEVVTLTCNSGYTGNAEATCVGPGQWSVTTTCSVTTTPAATTTSAGATAFGSFWNGTPLVMLFVSAICNHF